MSDTPVGPGWWLASDGKWYPPQAASPAPPPPPPVMPPMGSASVPPPPYGYTPTYAYAQTPAPQRSNTDTYVYFSLGFGVGSILFSIMCGILGVLMSFIAIGFGIFGLMQKKKEGDASNKWAAWTGIGLGVASLVLLVVIFALLLSMGTASTLN